MNGCLIELFVKHCYLILLTLPFNFVDILNWIAWNRTVWSFNCVETNDGYLIKMVVLNSSSWKYLTVCKQMRNGKKNYSY